jgi:hypothetical protein
MSLALLGVITLGLAACGPRAPATGTTTPAPESAATPAAAEPEPVAQPTAAQSPEELTCERPDMFGPVMLTPEQYLRRTGAEAKKFSDLPTTKELPIEVCGTDRQLEFLTRVTCDDGSHPFAHTDAAHRARVGSVGPGGRCGSIIDRYRVPCPEGTYDVFMDLYMCTTAL